MGPWIPHRRLPLAKFPVFISHSSPPTAVLGVSLSGVPLVRFAGESVPGDWEAQFPGVLTGRETQGPRPSASYLLSPTPDASKY